MSWIELAIVLIGGFMAGAINSLAGNGSAITLTILTEVLGLAPNLANGTNRIGVFLQTSVGAGEFARQGKLKLGQSKLYITITVLGAIGGVALATQVSNEQFYAVYRYMLLLMLPLILLKPSRWFVPPEDAKKLPLWISIPVFLLLGFYGGFIQMGMGLFFLAAMVLLARFDIMRANAVKLLVIGIYTLIVLIILDMKGLVDWPIGLLMASGQTIGGWLSVNWASKYPSAQIWAYRLLIVVVMAGIFLAFFHE